MMMMMMMISHNESWNSLLEEPNVAKMSGMCYDDSVWTNRHPVSAKSSSSLISDVVRVWYMNFGSPCNTFFPKLISYLEIGEVFSHSLNLSCQKSTPPSALHANL